MIIDDHSTNVRPVTQKLVESFRGEPELTPATMVDFGIDTPLHYATLRFAVLEGGVRPRQLDEAMGDGTKLTALVNSVDCNPFGITFHTSWDVIYGRDSTAEQRVEPVAAHSVLLPQRHRKSRQHDREQER